MAFNKSKALENALKFLNQGKVAQAIGEYQLILRADPKDQATLMTVGDLFARQGDMTQAIEYFERLAQVYLNDGFNSKAIAIYKKIAKLAPNELAPLERLADLYVQQGVLSEARPLFLQIAEAHLKANHAQKAIEVLHRLLEVEPENQRVQMRLAELYGMMGLKKEASLTYQTYAHRLFDRGETEEAEKLVERALEVDPGNAAAILLKAKILSAANKLDHAIEILNKHPEAETDGDVTKLLVEYELQAERHDHAADRARRQLARGHAHYGLLYKVAESHIEGSQPDHALPLLAELRAPMIEAGAQDHFLKLLTSACDRLPGRTEPLETLADFCRTTSDPFRLNAALGQLSDAYAAKGDFPRAEELLVELVERNKNDERLVDRLNELRARSGGAPVAGGTSAESAAAISETHAGPRESVAEEQNKLIPPAPPVIAEEALDEETQRYIAQALTDVDLFSSYGLTQKATHLLENVLQRAPRHTLRSSVCSTCISALPTIAAPLNWRRSSNRFIASATTTSTPTALPSCGRDIQRSRGSRSKICRRLHLCQLRQRPLRRSPSLYPPARFPLRHPLLPPRSLRLLRLRRNLRLLQKFPRLSLRPSSSRFPWLAWNLKRRHSKRQSPLRPKRKRLWPRTQLRKTPHRRKNRHIPSSQASAKSWISPTNGKQFRLRCKNPKRLRRKGSRQRAWSWIPYWSQNPSRAKQ